MKEYLSDLKLESLVGSPEIKFKKMCLAPQDCSPQEFPALMLDYTQSSAILQNYYWSVLTSLWLQQLLFQVN